MKKIFFVSAILLCSCSVYRKQYEMLEILDAPNGRTYHIWSTKYYDRKTKEFVEEKIDTLEYEGEFNLEIW